MTQTQRVRGAHASLAVLAAWLLVPACGSQEPSEAPAETDDQAAPPESTLQGPVSEQMRHIDTDDADRVARGEELFATCAGCHGQGGSGITGTGPRLNSESFLAAASDEMLLRTISQGRSGTTMIPWGQSLSDEDIRSLVAYIRSWGPVEPAELDQSPLDGDEDTGGALFREICAACHGRSGAGYQETANGTGIGRAAFLSQVSNGYLRYIIKHGKTNTQMKSFEEGSKVAVANLSDQQIDDVITYLRKNAW
jgi:mono/diheme cytochrome c family protein